jgi:exopolysaccharide biosynthesis polyprenyl glycosylphosphotransferase
MRTTTVDSSFIPAFAPSSPIARKINSLLQDTVSAVVLMALDGLILGIALRLGSLALGQVHSVGLLPVIILMLWLILSSLGLYTPIPQRCHYGRVVLGIGLLSGLAVGASYYYELLSPVRALTLVGGMIASLLLVMGRWGFDSMAIYLRAETTALVVGCGETALQWERDIHKALPHTRLLGRVALENGSVGTFKQLLDALQEFQPQQLIISAPALSPLLFRQILGYCDTANIQLLLLHPPLTGRRKLHMTYSPLPLVEVRESTGLALELFGKRCLDFAIALLGIILLAPVFLMIAVLIFIDDPGPIFFRQLRLGLGGKQFWVWKFRTMVVDAERRLAELEKFNESDGGVLFKMQKDPRVTHLGNFLRRTSLDELPQFFNILQGHMSLVGPRPLQLRDCELGFKRSEEAFTRRFAVLPGVTGLWQVRGRSEVGFDDMVNFDIEYMEQWTLWLDVQILWETLLVVVRRKGAY